MTKTDGTSGVKWTPIYEECIYVPVSVLRLAIHKIEQTKEGQYPKGQALDAALGVLRRYLPNAYDNGEIRYLMRKESRESRRE